MLLQGLALKQLFYMLLKKHLWFLGYHSLGVPQLCDS